MPNIGLKDVYIAVITEDDSGNETYDTPELFAPAISANINIEYAEGKLYADDKIYVEDKQFNGGTVSFNYADIAAAMAAKVLGSRLDSNGVLVDSVEDNDRAPFVAVGFKSLRSGGKYEYDWLYRVRFSKPNASYQTKGDSFNYNTQTLEGKIYERNKPLANGSHPWRVKVVDGESAESAATIASWFNAVYEPSFTNEP